MHSGPTYQIESDSTKRPIQSIDQYTRSSILSAANVMGDMDSQTSFQESWPFSGSTYFVLALDQYRTAGRFLTVHACTWPIVFQRSLLFLCLPANYGGTILSLFLKPDELDRRCWRSECWPMSSVSSSPSTF